MQDCLHWGKPNLRVQGGVGVGYQRMFLPNSTKTTGNQKEIWSVGAGGWGIWDSP